MSEVHGIVANAPQEAAGEIKLGKASVKSELFKQLPGVGGYRLIVGKGHFLGRRGFWTLFALPYLTEERDSPHDGLYWIDSPRCSCELLKR